MIRSYSDPEPQTSVNVASVTSVTSVALNPGEIRKPGREEESDRKIEQTIAYMLEHLDQSLQVAELAALANMSASHYTALFKRRTGCAPIDFFIRQRMRRACQLLDTTSLHVKEVAARLGYDDPFYFSRTFKSVNQVAPTEYRMLRDKQRTVVPAATDNWCHVG